MSSRATTADRLFTAFAGLCAVVATVVFIAVGAAIARATFSPHGAHATASPEQAETTHQPE